MGNNAVFRVARGLDEKINNYRMMMVKFILLLILKKFI